MERLLTLIIPTYNMEKYLRMCLDSLIIGQRQEQFEVLVINDGSKDSSSTIAHEYEKKYPETFRVIDKENGNYGSCVNRGLKEALGKYVKVLDADDTLDTKNFSSYIDFLANNDVDCVISDVMQVDGLGECTLLSQYNLPKDRLFTLEEIGDTVYDLCMHCVCYKTEKLRAINYHQTEGISYTDQEWICLPMAICKILVYFPKVIYKYLVGRDGQTIETSVWEKNFWMEIQGTKVMMKYRDMGYGSIVPNQNFIDLRIKVRMRAIYIAYLMKFSSFSNDNLVREIDRCLLTYDRDMYNDLSTFRPMKRIPIPIVKLWRNRHLGWIPVYRWIYKAKISIRGLIKSPSSIFICSFVSKLNILSL